MIHTDTDGWQGAQAAQGAAPALLTAEELGVRYQVTGATVRKWFREGRIPAAVAVGRVLRFDAEEVAAALRTDALEVRKRVAGMCEIF
jgi:excisionase family DNA binding protein